MAKTMKRERNMTTILQARVEPELAEIVRQLQAGNKVESESAMVRLLIRRGVRAVMEDQGKPVTSDLPARDIVLIHVDALNDVLDGVKARDPRTAIRLAVDATTALGLWAEREATIIGTTVPEVYNGSDGSLS